MEFLDNICRFCLKIMLIIYRMFISPFLPNRCCFYPSCSIYALDTLQNHNIFMAIFYITRRLLKCHPWSKGGIDLPKKPK